MSRILVGREHEVNLLSGALRDTLSGKGCHLLLYGPAGIGKTALIEDTCIHASELGFRVLRGASTRESAQPFSVLTGAFSRLEGPPLFEEQECVSFAEVFAINRAGLLMAKASAHGGNLDADIFAGMLTAVQNFVRDSFDATGTGEANLGRLEYGDMKILIENGDHLFLTAVLVGQEHSDMAASLRNTVRAIETENGTGLESWNGNMGEMKPIEESLKSLVAKQFTVRRDMAGINLENEIIRISEAAMESLARNCSESPILLVLEDLQWAGESSLRVLEYIARNSPGIKLMVLTSARPSESGGFEQCRARMASEGTVIQAVLSGFNLEAMKNMIDAMYSPNVFSPEMFADLFSRTEGNPLFAEELVRHLEASGAILFAEGKYRYTEAAVSLPVTVEDLIAGRLDSLRPDALKAAEVASCIGREFESRVLGQLPVLGNSMDCLAALESSGIVSRTDDFGSFSHGLFQEVVYASISPRWKSKYHRELGDYYERAFEGRLDEVIYELARHFSKTSEHYKALDYCTRAGEKAEAGFAVEQALNFYGNALAACGTDIGKEAMLHDRMGDLCFILSDCKGAIGHYQATLGRAGDRAIQADMLRKIADSYEKLSDYDSAKEQATKGLELLSGEESAVEARLLMSIGRIRMRQGDYSMAAEILSRAAASAEKHDLRKDMGMAEHLLGTVYLHKGDYADAKIRFEKAAAIRTEIGDLPGYAASINNIGNVYARTGEWEKALEFYVPSSETDAKTGDKLGLASSLTNIATVYLSLGKPDEAIPILEKSIAIERKIGDRRGLAISLLNLNMAHYLKLDYAKSVAILHEALEICEKNSLRYECIFCYNGLCELYSLLGRTAEGIELARKSLAMSREMGTKEGEAMSLMHLGAAVRETGNLEEAREHLESALSLMVAINHNQIADSNHQLGLLWTKIGDRAKAKQFFETALAGYEKNKDQEKVDNCRNRIAELG